MIPLHRLTHPDEPVYVNPDLIAMVEANPDTVVTLTNSSKLVVAESPEQVTALVCAWRSRVVAQALEGVEEFTPREVALATVSHLPTHPA